MEIVAVTTADVLEVTLDDTRVAPDVDAVELEYNA
jgi:hypothetical protein